VFGFAVAAEPAVGSRSRSRHARDASAPGACSSGRILYAIGCAHGERDHRARLTLAIGVFVGIGMSCTLQHRVRRSRRAYPPEKRSVVLGISRGRVVRQFVMLPLALVLITGLGWYAALIGLSLAWRW